jgi:hypothetical protein
MFLINPGAHGLGGLSLVFMGSWIRNPLCFKLNFELNLGVRGSGVLPGGGQGRHGAGDTGRANHGEAAGGGCCWEDLAWG